MKYFILTFGILFVTSICSFSQEIDVTYKVTNYEINGVNYDNLALNGDVALSFYMCDEETLCFTNRWRKAGSQSYGSVHAMKKRDIPETETNYRAVEMKFTWNYFNTYDSRRGQAAVTITNIFIRNIVKFTAEIVLLDTNEILIFKGYLEDF